MTAPNDAGIPRWLCPACKAPDAELRLLQRAVVVVRGTFELKRGVAYEWHTEPLWRPQGEPWIDADSLERMEYECSACRCLFTAPALCTEQDGKWVPVIAGEKAKPKSTIGIVRKYA